MNIIYHKIIIVFYLFTTNLLKYLIIYLLETMLFHSMKYLIFYFKFELYLIITNDN